MSVDQGRASERVQRAGERLAAIRAEVGRILVGQDALVTRLLIGLVGDGHLLLEGVPGLAKTLAVRTLAGALGLKFRRIQFTPDLLPADLTGTLVYNPSDHSFTAKRGPVFANLVLADEINRAPAKVQSALLEAMQERQVTISDRTYPLPAPFFVMATQNPIEQEGTYPLPEAQIDRFMLKCRVDYPSRDDERRIMQRFTRQEEIVIHPVLQMTDVLKLREDLEQVYCDEKVGDYLLDIVRATRKPAEYGLKLAQHIHYGGSPRAAIYLNLAARAHALLNGRAYTTPQDVKEVAPDVLRHRVLLTYEAEAEELTSDAIVSTILSEIPVP